MVMGRQLSLNKSLDSTILKGEAQDKVNEGEKLDELGAKFVSDKEKLEAEIDKVEKSNISNADKSKLLDKLKNAIVSLKEQYDKDVSKENEKIQKKLQEKTDEMQEAEDEMQEQIDSLNDMEIEAADIDTSALINEAKDKKKDFEKIKTEYVKKLEAQINANELQRREILKERLRGR